MSQTLDIWEINRKRAVMKVEVTSLCVQAGVGVRTYYDALDGRYSPKPATLAKLNTALGRFKQAIAGELGPITLHSAYKLALVLAAFQLKASAREAINSDPTRKATANKDWMEAARTRQLAFWIVNVLLGFKQSEVARAAGVSKQAVHAAIKDIENEEDADISRACQQLEEVFR